MAKRKTSRKNSGTGEAPWLYGRHAVLAALANPARRCRRLVATSDMADALKSVGGPAPDIMGRNDIAALLPQGAVHQGLAGRFDPLPETDLADALGPGSNQRRCLVMLDQVTDPQNVGAVLRSAAAFGIGAVIVQDRHSPALSGALAKAASGALETVPLIHVTNLSRALDAAKDAGFWTVGLTVDGAETLGETALPDRAVIVFGAEDSGLRRLVRDHCDHLVRIPIGSGMESLNVAASAAVTLYEWARGA